jgi:hypothetical protein
MSLAVGIVSSGLDSLLSMYLVRRMGFDVLALHFVTGFEAALVRRLRADPDAPLQPPGPLARAAAQTGSEARAVDIREEFLRLLIEPPHGFGSHMNPCLDCKIGMLRHARRIMEERGGALVFTGEVLGQRPMSQHRQALDLIERESGLSGRLLRPLCGRLLPATEAERSGLLSRDALLSIRGRSRKEQMALAREVGLTDYPTPAGGCLLTDPGYAARVRALMERRPGRMLRLADPLLLSLGRHAALPGGGFAVIGRNQEENLCLERFAATGALCEARDAPGPITWIEAPFSSTDLEAAARLTAWYGKGRTLPRVNVAGRSADGGSFSLEVAPGFPADCRLLGEP